MRIPWRRRPTPQTRQLLAAAGLDRGLIMEDRDLSVCREVAFRAAQRGDGTIDRVIGVAEELLEDEANYEFVVAFLEDLQNLVSHGLEPFLAPEDVNALLGPRCMVCWTTLEQFWNSVASWCERAGLPLEPNKEILSVENAHLQALLWTMNRSLPSGQKLGLADAVRYEKAGEPPIPGYSHIAIALRSTGEG